MGGSKLGAHVLVMGADAAQFIAAGPAVMKFAGDWGSAAGVKQGACIIGRLVDDEDAQQQRAQGRTPEQAAKRFIARQIGTYKANPAIRFWEGYNEPVWGDLDGMKWYADLEIARMRQMEALGFKCVIGNFATGTPPMELWPAFIPAMQAARQYGAILGLHEYGAVWLWWMTGHYQVDEVENCVDPRNPSRIEGWTTLRYRQVYRRFFETAGVGDVPLVINEFGLDPMVGPTPPGIDNGFAWRDAGSAWRRADYTRYPIPAGVKYSDDNAQFYAEQLYWYDRQMQQDPYVIGATIFTFGSFGGDWQKFDVCDR